MVRKLPRILLGAILYAIGFAQFLVPNQVNGGGVTGIGQLVATTTPFHNIGLFVLLCNIPLFLLAYRHVGRSFFWWSLFGMVVSSILVDVFALFGGISTEPLMACLFGGLALGTGIGLVFQAGASTGGIDIVARLLQKKFPHMPMGKLLMGADLMVVSATALVFWDLGPAMYSVVTIAITGLVIDRVIYGQNDCGVALIVTTKPWDLAQAIGSTLGRGTTLLEGMGSYTKQPKPVLLVAVKPQQLHTLQSLISTTDRDAFVIVQKAHQVYGLGFQS